MRWGWGKERGQRVDLPKGVGCSDCDKQKKFSFTAQTRAVLVANAKEKQREKERERERERERESKEIFSIFVEKNNPLLSVFLRQSNWQTARRDLQV
jgi:hypothetical protein